MNKTVGDLVPEGHDGGMGMSESIPSPSDLYYELPRGQWFSVTAWITENYPGIDSDRRHKKASTLCTYLTRRMTWDGVKKKRSGRDIRYFIEEGNR